MQFPRSARIWPIVFIVCVAALFLIANRGAYRGYFNDDDLDNLVQTRGASGETFLLALEDPRLSRSNFRPVGHGYYKLLGMWAGLQYKPYVGVLHAVHLLNVVLVLLLLRQLGAGWLGAGAGTLLFAFHIACFDGYWKPMFFFDVMCATFLLLALLLYLRGHWLLALIPYWLAYKTKEPAIALPAVLLAWEWMLGEKRWKRVLPYAAIAASFALQAMMLNRGTNDDYTLRFTAAAVMKTFGYYSSQVLLAPYAGVLLIALAAWTKDRRVRFGLLALALLMGPMWFLPGRLFAVYLYVPLIGLAVAAAFFAEKCKPAYVTVFFVLWLPVNYLLLRQQRGAALTVAMENQLYVEAVGKVLAGDRDVRTILYDGGPAGMREWGIEATMRWFQPAPELRLAGLESAEARGLMEREYLAVMSWDRARRRLVTASRQAGDPAPASITMATGNPVWLFGEGWYPLESGFRWTKAEAKVRLRRPEGAAQFAVRVNLGPVQKKEQGQVEVELLLDGKSLGTRVYSDVCWCEQVWTAPAGAAGDVEVTLRSLRPYRPSNGDPRTLGAAVASLGFVAVP
ncbi:MAG: hypothetical protein HY858_05475 [Candidatus Solibacter usitatus]|nr:hypothetical protein [Candidatus Solibacter usitatus]